jgi:hypothetical protein
MRCFVVVGCTSGLRFDAGVVFSEEKARFSLRRAQGKPCDKLKASAATGLRRGLGQALGEPFGAGCGQAAARTQYVYYYTLFCLRCQWEKWATGEKSIRGQRADDARLVRRGWTTVESKVQELMAIVWRRPAWGLQRAGFLEQFARRGRERPAVTSV